MPGTYDFLKIGDDPTNWKLSEPIDAAALIPSGNAPFSATIVAPRTGTLLLSGRAAASVVLWGLGGATPNGGPFMVQPFLYLPSVTGLTSTAPGSMYALSGGTELQAVAAQITTAMSQGQPCTLQLSDGVAVLNGATLPFAVLFEAAAGG
jgi:hypothetical protein